MSGFVHARTFDTRWGIGLAFIDLDDETNIECLRLQLWAPVCDDGSDGKITLRIGLNLAASDEAHDRMSEANRSALVEMDTGRFEAVFDTAGAGSMLDAAIAKATQS